MKTVFEKYIFWSLNSNLGPENPFGNSKSKPMLHNFWKLPNPGIYVLLKSWSQLLPGKVAQISDFYCGWKMFLAKVLCRCKLVPCWVEPGGVTFNDVLVEDCPQSPVLNIVFYLEPISGNFLLWLIVKP